MASQQKLCYFTFNLQTNLCKVKMVICFKSIEITCIECFIEDQAFSPSHDLALTPPLLFPSPLSKLSLFLSLSMFR